MGTSSAFTVTLPQTYRSVTSISLVSLELSFAMYNIMAPYCQGVTFTHNAVPYTFTLTPGFYQIADVQAALLSALSAAFPTAGVTAVNYATSSACLSIVYTSGLAFTAQISSGGLLGRVLGLDPLGTTAVASGGVLTMPYVANLFPISSLFLRVAELPSLCTSTNNITAFARIQLSSAPGGVVMANNGSGVVNTNNYTNAVASLPTLTCSLYTTDGQPVSLNGVEWSFTLLINSA